MKNVKPLIGYNVKFEVTFSNGVKEIYCDIKTAEFNARYRHSATIKNIKTIKNDNSDIKKYKVYVKSTIFGKQTLHECMTVYAERYENNLVKLTNEKGKVLAIIKQEEAKRSLKYI